MFKGFGRVPLARCSVHAKTKFGRHFFRVSTRVVSVSRVRPISVGKILSDLNRVRGRFRAFTFVNVSAATWANPFSVDGQDRSAYLLSRVKGAFTLLYRHVVAFVRGLANRLRVRLFLVDETLARVCLVM